MKKCVYNYVQFIVSQIRYDILRWKWNFVFRVVYCIFVVNYPLLTSWDILWWLFVSKKCEKTVFLFSLENGWESILDLSKVLKTD